MTYFVPHLSILTLKYALADFYTVLKNQANIVSVALSHGHPFVPRCIKKAYSNKHKVIQRATVSKSALMRQIQWISEQKQMCQPKYTLLGITAFLRVT